MMNSRYTEQRLRRELVALFDERRQAGDKIEPQWAALTLCDRHRQGLQSVADDDPIALQDAVAFWDTFGYAYVRKLATRCVNDMERAHQQDDEQQVLPGFEYLQTGYVIERNGVAMDVAIDDATDDELLAKADLYEAQAMTQLAHADELRRYVSWRRAQRDDDPHADV